MPSSMATLPTLQRLVDYCSSLNAPEDVLVRGFQASPVFELECVTPSYFHALASPLRNQERVRTQWEIEVKPRRQGTQNSCGSSIYR
jgi:hypothetical protein